MPRQNDSGVQSSSGDWMFHLGPVRVHNRHVQSGVARRLTGCDVCAQELGGLVEAIAAPAAASDGVVKGDGSYEEDDPSSSSGGWSR